MSQFSGPDFYHQLGHQDQKRCLELLRDGRGAGAIISPRDIKTEPLLQHYAQQYKSTNAQLLVDPQMYTMQSTQNQNSDVVLDATADMENPRIAAELLQASMEKQHSLSSSYYIIPGPFAVTITDSWVNTIRNFSEGAKSWRSKSGSRELLFATLAISVAVVENDETRLRLLDSVSGLQVDGFYIVSDVPSQPSNAALLYGMMDIVFRLKRNGFKLLAGYTEPWALLTFPFGLDGFASSALKNRRSFHHTQWKGQKPSGGKRPPYEHFWSPLILDSIRLPDDAQTLCGSSEGRAIWRELYSHSEFAHIFDRQSPTQAYTSKQWGRTDSYNNYSHMMVNLGRQFRSLDFAERIETVKERLSSADALRNRIRRAGVPLRSSPEYITSWQSGFDRYFNIKGDDIYDEFG